MTEKRLIELLFHFEKLVDLAFTFIATKVPNHLKTKEIYEAFVDHGQLKTELHVEMKRLQEKTHIPCVGTPKLRYDMVSRGPGAPWPKEPMFIPELSCEHTSEKDFHIVPIDPPGTENRRWICTICQKPVIWTQAKIRGES